ncbi:MAG: MGH1-like glycoside hydrolase domain-containing protein, partial [Thermoanaerobaculia bacterium]
LYKYPQREYPYGHLVEENKKRSPHDPEYELIDTGIFDEQRYFDIFVEIAKDDEDTLLFRVTAHNRGPERAPLHLLPHLWFRNTWSWGPHAQAAPMISAIDRGGVPAIVADDSGAPPLAGLLHSAQLGPHVLEMPKGTELLFTDNETNAKAVFGWADSRSRYTKDAFHRYVVNGEKNAVNPERRGTKACGHVRVEIEPGRSYTMRMRMSPAKETSRATDAEIDALFARRIAEADEFYTSIHPARAGAEERLIQRQAFAGMLWTKQSYLFDVDVWLDGDNPAFPPPASRLTRRNRHWRHLNSMRILSMPDKWEYPWFAAWDLAFHAVVFALIDGDFAKEQLWLMLFEQFQHPNGQIPAYEWEFSDLNPPVHAWAVWRVYNMDRIRNGKPDRAFLEKCFHKLMLNFTWWVNKVDSQGNNVFEGGFLGLDNITLFDRSDRLPGDAILEQSDATGWMGMFSLMMMRIALELAQTNSTYEGLATKFFEHYVYIGAAMKMIRGDRTLWDEEDDFFYDLLRFPNGSAVPFRVRSLVGLIPLYAIERLEGNWIEPFPVFRENLNWFLKYRPELVERSVTTVQNGHDFTHVLAVVDQHQLQCLLSRVLDPQEFLAPHGLRSLSKFHQEHPFSFGNATVGYEPAESHTRLKGGNSNWRGPVWFPTTFLMIESLRKLEKAFGESVKLQVHEASPITLHGNVPLPTEQELADTRATEGIGATGDIRARGMRLHTAPSAPLPREISLNGLAARLAERLIRIFLPDPHGYRPVNGARGTRRAELFAHDPHWKDLVLFYEYFNADTGEGLGASHQTGWTGLIANVIDEWRV